MDRLLEYCTPPEMFVLALPPLDVGKPSPLYQPVVHPPVLATKAEATRISYSYVVTTSGVAMKPESVLSGAPACASMGLAVSTLI